MNRVNSRNDMWSWWQHYKYRPDIIIILLFKTIEYLKRYVEFAELSCSAPSNMQLI